MAYNYYPTYFPNNQYYPNSLQMPSNAPNSLSNAQQGNQGGILWVQGEASAKAYPVAPGQSVLLMDSEDAVMYIKSTDQSGMPLPLRIFDYTERKSPNTDTKSEKPTDNMEKYVSRKEFETFRSDMEKALNGFRKPSDEAEG